MAGAAPVVLEKSRGLGGRLATRRAGEYRFDHGAQYLRPRGPEFAAFLDALKPAEAVDVWLAVEDGAPAYVGLPGMSGLLGPLAEGLDIRHGVEIATATRVDDHWELTDADGVVLARAEVLISAIPAPQAARVLAGHPLADQVAAVKMDPCWTLMVAFESRPNLPDITRMPEAVLEWIARDGGKPGRDAETWVVQAGTDWSRDNLELTKEEAADELMLLLQDRAGGTLPEIRYAAAHRWRYAEAATPLGQPCLADPDTGLVIAGDWCLGPRAEHAVLSAEAALAALVPLAAAASVSARTG